MQMMQNGKRITFKALKLLPEFKNFEGKLGLSAKNLLNCLTLKDEVSIIFEKLYPFAKLQQDENTADNKYQALTGKAQTLLTDFSAAVSFIEPELNSLPEDKLNKFRKQEKGFKKYDFYFENLFKQKKHILSQNEDEILSRSAQIAQVPSDVFNMLTNADIKFPEITDEKGKKVQLSEGRYSSFIRSTDRHVRQETFNSLLGTYNQYRNTLAATLDGNVKQSVFYSKVRKYPSCLEAALSPHNIPVSVYNNLV